jgi:hypothetical protein
MYFGLTESEMGNLLEEYDLSIQLGEIQQWYNGYQFGNSIIYNPWSITNFLVNKAIQAYWVNTSENTLIRNILIRSPIAIKQDCENLLKGKLTIKKFEEHLIFESLGSDTNSIWNLLLAGGYLTITTNQEIYNSGRNISLKIPNREVQYLFEDIIIKWFINPSGIDLSMLLQNLIDGNISEFNSQFQSIIEDIFSVFDVGKHTSENFYHAFTLGLLIALKNRYEINSNRESGYGRYDLALFPMNKLDPGIIIEFKLRNIREEENLDETAERALNQIEEKKYEQSFIQRGINFVRKFAFGFDGRKIIIKSKSTNVQI